jgi:hypothetical protein
LRERRAVPSDANGRRYLDLMERCLTNVIYGDPSIHPTQSHEPYDPRRRRVGEDWPKYGHTMIGLERLHNVRRCAERVIDDGVPGDFIETGVWRGGAAIMMRAVLAARAVHDRNVWVADSFRGVPPPDVANYPQDEGLDLSGFADLAVSQDTVAANFSAYGLLDDQVRFLPGWFRDTLPDAPIERIALLRLDGDLYESTIVALRALYHKLSPGGYVIVDDYGAFEACARAVRDFRSEAGVDELLERIDWTGVFWRKAIQLRGMGPSNARDGVARGDAGDRP